MKYISDYNFAGKRALMRVDFNVPLQEDLSISDDTRLRAALPSIQKILSDGGSLVLMSHLGRPKGVQEARFSLSNVVGYLTDALGVDVKFVSDCVSEEAFAASSALSSGEVLLLENLRFHAAEKKGDKDFARALARHGDVYVNDAFGTAHRAHASTAVIAEFFEDKICGYVIKAELENARRILEIEEKQRPFVAIVGGAKVSDKMLVLERLIDKVDMILIGGGMAYTFIKAQGGDVGNSLVETDRLELAANLLKKAEDRGVRIYLPEDSTVAAAFKADAAHDNAPSHQIMESYMGLDIGEQARETFRKNIVNAKTVLWNGPMGVFEMAAFAKGTFAIAKAVVAATQKGAFSLIGGGDSAAAIAQMGFTNEVSYVSTGGGALLELIEGKTLPGIAALD
ncbi:MAG: phosphoglycerate kinase [Bernardetiaceae bacterium]|nr:phosphoglycerate kinase [Bernardetiaceae bacterium]